MCDRRYLRVNVARYIDLHINSDLLKMVKSKISDTKHQLKFLQCCQSVEVIKAVLKAASDSVIKVICNVALNVQKGEVTISRKDKIIFRKHQAIIRKLFAEKFTIKQKRDALVKAHCRGGILLVPALLTCAHKTFGTRLYSQKQRK